MKPSLPEKTPEPAISVIVPVYNVESFVEEAVDSIICQDFEDFEVLLVDDCSTDCSSAVCRALADRYPEKVRYFRQPENRGLSVSRNVGLDNARGRYVVFLDSDDAYLPGALVHLYALAEAHPDAGIVCGRMVNEESLKDVKLGPIPKSVVDAAADNVRVIGSDEALERVLYQTYDPYHSAWGKIYRRELFRELRFRPGVYFEDMEIFPKLMKLTDRVVLTDREVYFYRKNPKSFLNSWGPSRLDALMVTDEILTDIRQTNPRLEKAARNLRLSANFNGFILASFHDRVDVADRTWRVIVEERIDALKDPKVRLKNKIGIMLSFLGRRALLAVARRKGSYNV